MHEGVGLLAAQLAEGASERVGFLERHREDRDGEFGRGGPEGPELKRMSAKLRVQEDGDSRRRRNDLLEVREAFGDQVGVGIRQPGDVAAGPRQAGDVA